METLSVVPKLFQKSPYCDDLPKVKFIVVDLCNEDGCKGLVQSSAVHVNCGSHRQHKPCDAPVHTIVFFQAPEGYGQSRWAERNLQNHMNCMYADFGRRTKPLHGLWPYPPVFSPCHVSQRPEAARRKNSLSKTSSDMMHAAVAHSDMAFLRGLGQGLYNPEADDAGTTPKEGGFRVHRAEPQDQNSFFCC